MAACDIAWLNGYFLPLAEARISPLDRACLFGDAVYEVLPVYSGRVYRLEQHLDRLDRSLGEIRMTPPLTRTVWHSVCGGLVQRNGGGDLLIYLQVSRGTEPDRAHVPCAEPAPTVFAFASHLPSAAADAATRATPCVTADDNSWGRCDIKSTSLLANVLLRWAAQDAGAAEAVLLRDGLLTEGAASSVHVVRDGRLVTPPPSASILPGTTRDVLRELGPRCGIECIFDDISERELRGAPEAMLASAGAGPRAIVSLDGRPVGNGLPGPVFRRLYAAWLDSRFEFSTECRE